MPEVVEFDRAVSLGEVLSIVVKATRTEGWRGDGDDNRAHGTRRDDIEL
jgi:hypothetical protein